MKEINNNFHKSQRIQPIKKLSWIFSSIVQEIQKTRAPTCYNIKNESGKAGYKSENLSKVDEITYESVLKSELYAILMVMRDFNKLLNTVIDLQYTERIDLHIETTEFISDDTKFTLLFIQL